ncbi:GMC family oxidoreductase N-terminal domain-containing protein [Sphingomonadaceae bacterium G21617-S1]|nr:GMC family oxidoreductase N-terminal domain-containing protein [Sphingomonadaceae bacterium G21617-S1]
MKTADYVIVGGGSAGCVVANRLSEDPATSVILIEAGGNGKGFWVDMPVGLIKLLGNPKSDWCYVTEPDPTIKGRRLLWNAGKMLGGSSGLNGLVYIRGQRDDYDDWERMGCPGWSFADVFPYFLKGEHWEGEENSQSHGRTGTLSVAPLRSEHPLVPAFLEACRNYGLPIIDDYCGGSIDGAFRAVTNQHNGRRCSAAKAFIEPARGRPNLTILTHTQIDRVLFDGRTAVGVEGRDASGQRVEVRARREVILSGGATQSPTILMRSGVGAADQLRAFGIDVVTDRPSVGQNLMEHQSVSLKWLVNRPALNAQLGNPLKMAGALLDYMMRGRGVMTSSLGYALAGFRTRPDIIHPDALLFFSSFVMDPTKPSMAPGRAHIYPLMKTPAAAAAVFVNRPYSRGQIRLRSASPHDHPVIEPGLLSDQRDVVTLIDALKVVEGIFASNGLAELCVRQVHPRMETDAEWEDFVRSNASIGWHASGTCRMGSDADAVVDPRLRVRGVEGLRVIDASIMPVVTSTNTNAPTMMIGEKGAAMIIEDAFQNAQAA